MKKGIKKNILLKSEALKAIAPYKDSVLNEGILGKIRSDLNDALNKVLEELKVYPEDFPIEFENSLGKWKILSDGTTYVEPKKTIQRISTTITILNSNDLKETNDPQ